MDGESVRLDRRKATALLAYLVATGQPHSRDTLATLLWPDHDQQRSRANLRNALLSLNKALGEQWLAQDREMVAFEPDGTCWIDILQFKQWTRCAGEISEPDCLRSLENAVELYRSHFLAGFSLRDSPDFDDWQRLESERLAARFESTLERIIACYRDMGDSESALAYARRWVGYDPLNEKAQADLISLYALTGQTAAAISQYHDLARRLNEELDIDPSSELVDLFERIKSGTFAPHATDAAPLKRPTSNLPPQATPFMGRAQEIDEIGQRLQSPDCHLMTLIGPGGIGKTRLALTIAEQHLSGFDEGVWYVPLNTLESPDLILPTVNQILAPILPDKNMSESQFLNALRGKSLLLVLDNFEHLAENASVVTRILSAGPKIKILVTSRTRLHLQEEWLYEVQGLRFPVDGHAITEGDDAVQLFLETAQRIQPEFVSDNASIVQICKLVGGLPLGIILAASWVRLLSCAEIARELRQGIDILKATLHNMPPRHQSMRAVLDQSWMLLTTAEQGAFMRLAVFHGGFRRDAAEQVAGVSLFTLMNLADKSLIYRSVSGRYELHELLHQFAIAKLGEVSPQLQSAHIRYFAGFIHERTELAAENIPLIEELDSDLENIQIAWDYAIHQAARPELHQLIKGLWHYYTQRSWYRAHTEDRYRATLALLGPDDADITGWVEESLAEIRVLRGDYDEAIDLFQQASGHSPDPVRRARCLRKKGDTLRLVHKMGDALHFYGEALTALDNETSDPEWWREWLMIHLEQMTLYYWENEWQKSAEIGQYIADKIELYAAPPQKIRYLFALGSVILRRNRYTDLDDVLQYLHLAQHISLEMGSTADIAWNHFLFGFAHLWNGDLEAAEANLMEALMMTEISGDVVLRARVTTYLTVTYRKLRRFDLVHDYVSRSRKTAAQAQLPEYLCMAYANDAWLAWCESRFDNVIQLGQAALDCWHGLEESHASTAFGWLMLCPLIGVALRQDRIDDAIDYARMMLKPSQQKLADPVTDMLEQAIADWNNKAETVRVHLQAALDLFHNFGYM